MPKVYIETYGCSANQSDSEIISGLLVKEGFSIVSNPNEADLIILNTCVVKSPTENRMKHRIKFLAGKGKPLVVAGCMANTEPQIIRSISPTASLIGPNSIQKISVAVNKVLKGKKICILDSEKSPKVCLPKIRKNPAIGIVQISSGCLGNCHFCQTKFARGNLFSYPSDMIIKEIKNGILDGVKEFWLTSQDCGCYGFDRKENLPMLLDKISKIDGKFYVRVGMMNPNNADKILDELIDSYKSDKIFKFLHLPVQSGSLNILRKMNRLYTPTSFKKIVKTFRKTFPKITIATDIIIGYPGETQGDYSKTKRLVKELRPDIVNISKFWPRPNTKAAEMKQVKRSIIEKRSQEMTKIVKKIQIEKNMEWDGWEGEVLIDEIGKMGMIGRNFAYKPIVTIGKLSEFRIVRVGKIYPTYLKAVETKNYKN